MPKEIELKYKIESPAFGREILKSDFISYAAQPNSLRSISMKAIYYDDEKLTLTSQKIGYRVRKENDCFTATVKWTQSQGSKGLSIRHEYNAAVADENAEPKIFSKMIEDAHVASLLCRIEPIPLFVTEFERELLLVTYKGSIIEVAFDSGIISAGESKILPICELECELKDGTEAELIEFGEELSEIFKLTPFNDSKLKRGLSLIL